MIMHGVGMVLFLGFTAFRVYLKVAVFFPRSTSCVICCASSSSSSSLMLLQCSTLHCLADHAEQHMTACNTVPCMHA